MSEHEEERGDLFADAYVPVERPEPPAEADAKPSAAAPDPKGAGDPNGVPWTHLAWVAAPIVVIVLVAALLRSGVPWWVLLLIVAAVVAGTVAAAVVWRRVRRRRAAQRRANAATNSVGAGLGPVGGRVGGRGGRGRSAAGGGGATGSDGKGRKGPGKAGRKDGGTGSSTAGPGGHAGGKKGGKGGSKSADGGASGKPGGGGKGRGTKGASTAHTGSGKPRTGSGMLSTGYNGLPPDPKVEAPAEAPAAKAGTARAKANRRWWPFSRAPKTPKPRFARTAPGPRPRIVQQPRPFPRPPGVTGTPTKSSPRTPPVKYNPPKPPPPATPKTPGGGSAAGRSRFARTPRHTVNKEGTDMSNDPRTATLAAQYAAQANQAPPEQKAQTYASIADQAGRSAENARVEAAAARESAQALQINNPATQGSNAEGLLAMAAQLDLEAERQAGISAAYRRASENAYAA